MPHTFPRGRNCGPQEEVKSHTARAQLSREGKGK